MSLPEKLNNTEGVPISAASRCILDSFAIKIFIFERNEKDDSLFESENAIPLFSKSLYLYIKQVS